jgi:glycosyltransferase involved in cell wall biosynthesis
MTLRLLMICPQFYPLVGGYERAAERLCGALAAIGIDVTVVAERRDSAWPSLELVNGFVIRRLPCIYKRRLHMLTSLLGISWFLLWQGRRFDVWHVHQYGLHAFLALTAGKILGRPVVLKLTNSGVLGINEVISQLPFSRQVAGMLRSVDACVAISRETRDEALEFGIQPDRIHVLGNGVDVQTFHPVALADRLNARARFGLDPQKNPDGLLFAWKIALSRMPEGWMLALVGDGPLQKVLARRIEEEGLSGSVRLMGAREDVERWMNAADIFVLSSHHEGLANTMLEAMASGLPVVCTRVSGGVENLEETGAGLVVNVGGMDALAAALVRLSQDAPLRARMGNAGRSVVEDKYSIDHVAQTHLGLYRRLLTAKVINRGRGDD